MNEHRSMVNRMEVRFLAQAENEAFARMVISAFFLRANPTLTVMSEVRTAVSEAVTNAIVHAYCGCSDGVVVMRARLQHEQIEIEVEDFGAGIADVNQAMQPFYTSLPDEERTGIGFTLMQSFMDDVRVESFPGSGTVVRMTRRIAQAC